MTSRPVANLLSLPIIAYRRWLSPALPARCRFSPTCSRYALEALRTRGAVVGLALSIWRVLRCHPFHPGGYDPVPARRRRADVGRSIGGRVHPRNPEASPPVECSTPHSGAAQ